MRSRAGFIVANGITSLIRGCVLSFWFLLLVTHGFSQPTAMEGQVATANTTIDLVAGQSSPSVTGVGRSWRNEASEQLIRFVEMNGQRHAIAWRFNHLASTADERHVAFVYDSSNPHLRLVWTWIARAPTGPIEHTIKITNLDARELWIPLQASFVFSIPVDRRVELEHFYIEKGAGNPSDTGTHEVEMAVGYRWNGTSSTYAQLFRDEPREIIPWFAIQNTGPAGSGWYVGVEFSGRTHLLCERTARSVQGVVGLNPEPGSSFRTRLKAGESFTTPTVFVGTYSGDIDDLGNVLRPWVREVLGNPQAWRDSKYPLLVNNSWGSGMQVNEELARKMIRDSAELGLEMFHLDAGWFRGVGDWYPDPKKFPRGLGSLADYAHQHGLRFGLWIDWTQAGVDREPGALSVHDSVVHDWTVADVPPEWRPHEFKGVTIDIGVDAAREYAQHEVNRIVNDYRLDMLEHDGYLVAQGCVRADHPHASPDAPGMQVLMRDGNEAVEGSNSTDVSYHAVRSYYQIYEDLRKKHPHLLLEICNDGGRMVDFGTAAHGDYFSITDTYDPLSNRRAFYDASHVLPPAMLESYVEKWPTPKIENFRYMLRSGMIGWLTLMLDTTKWTANEHAEAAAEIQVYKKKLRPLIRDAGLYHVEARPDGVHWDGIEYFDPRKQEGVLYAFRGSDPHSSEHRFGLRGLDPNRQYRFHFQDRSNADRASGGRDLLRSGLTMRLPIPESSELVFFEAE